MNWDGYIVGGSSRKLVIPPQPPIADTLIRYLGMYPGPYQGSKLPKRGEPNYWHCPFHDDPGPSLTVTRGNRWKCFGCKKGGDPFEFVRQLKGLSFDGTLIEMNLKGQASHKTVKVHAPDHSSPPPPKSVLPPPEILEARRSLLARIIERGEESLWGPSGLATRSYLSSRGLTSRTIRDARLGWFPGTEEVACEGETAKVWGGILIPWWGEEGPAFINVRRNPGSRQRYQAIGPRSAATIYPGPHTVRPGRPVVITEGELDALLLAQELRELAAVVTLGSASQGPTLSVLKALSTCHPWYVATDADEAGDGIAQDWINASSRSKRIRPPAGKDWTEAHGAGANLREFWRGILPPREQPEGDEGGPAPFDPTAVAITPPRRPDVASRLFGMDEVEFDHWAERVAFLEADNVPPEEAEVLALP